jgi:Protein of unknown function (DUF3489)
MTAVQENISTKAKRAPRTPSANASKTAPSKKPSLKQVSAIQAAPDSQRHTARVTKHDRILELLNRPDGATFPELMQVTAWQQHSVRGFLAGTVKKKLGLNLTSSKAENGLRRYRIETKRGG